MINEGAKSDEQEEQIEETTLFEDLERIQNEQDKEDTEILNNSEEYQEETEEEKVSKTQTLFLDDGRLDYDIKYPINFKVGEIAEHFNLSSEELDRFSDIYEELYKIQFSHAVYVKSIQDQIKQKANKIDISRAISTHSSNLDKLSDLKMLSFLCDLVKIDESLKTKIIDKQIDSLFSKPVININNKYENTVLKSRTRYRGE